jgi:hypothetical protein
MFVLLRVALIHSLGERGYVMSSEKQLLVNLAPTFPFNGSFSSRFRYLCV